MRKKDFVVAEALISNLKFESDPSWWSLDTHDLVKMWDIIKARETEKGKS